jgi:phosphoheptose isomerase
MKSVIKHEFIEHIKAIQNTLYSIADQIETASKICVNSLKNAGKFNTADDVNLLVNTNDTNRIHEMHDFIGHIICHLIEQEFFKSRL